MARAKQKVDVEVLLHWALVRQCANVSADRFNDRALLSGGTRSATGAAEAILSLGARVDGGGSSGHRIPVDAITVSSAVDRLPGAARALVVISARSGKPPAWGEAGSGRWVPVIDQKGRQKKRWRDVRNSRGFLGFEWEWSGARLDDLEYERLQYWTWWHALEDLTKMLAGRLTEWQVTGPARPREPWNAAPVKIWHDDGDAA